MANWLIANHARVLSHLDEKDPPGKPAPMWRVALRGVRKIMRAIDMVRARLQGRSMLLSGQRAELQGLAMELMRFANVQGPINDIERQKASVENVALRGSFAVSRDDVHEWLKDLGLSVADMLEDVSLLDRAKIARSFAVLLVRLVDGIWNIGPDADGAGAFGRERPPVLPHELAKMRARDFVKLAREQRERLSVLMSEADILRIGEEHADSVEAVSREYDLRANLQMCAPKTTFEEGWGLVGGRFPFLRRFAGGLATVFPGASNVESDFSLVKWEENKFRQQMGSLSLAGVLHAKQFEKVQAIATE